MDMGVARKERRKVSPLLTIHLDEETARRLQDRAIQDGVSVEEEARELLGQALRPEWEAFWAEAERIRQSLAGRAFPDSADLIRRDRER